MDNSILITLIVAILGSGSATAIVTAVLNRIGKNNPMKVGLRLLLQDKIEYLGMKYIEAGEIRYDQLKYLNAAHSCYHSQLHGNGDLDALMEDVRDLPVIYPKQHRKAGTKNERNFD